MVNAARPEVAGADVGGEVERAVARAAVLILRRLHGVGDVRADHRDAVDLGAVDGQVSLGRDDRQGTQVSRSPQTLHHPKGAGPTADDDDAVTRGRAS